MAEIKNFIQQNIRPLALAGGIALGAHALTESYSPTSASGPSEFRTHIHEATATVQPQNNFRICLPILVSEIVCDPKTKGVDAALVVDVSGSMNEEVDHGWTRLEVALDAMENLVMIDQPFDQIALISFDTRATLRQELTGDRDKLLDKLSTGSIWGGGGTVIEEGVIKGLEELRSERHKIANDRIMVLLTDGHNGGSDESLLGSADEVKAEKIRLFTIGFGADVNEGLLREVASGPNDYSFGDSSNLAQIYESVYSSAPCCDPEAGHTDVAITLDASTSMKETLPDGATKLDAAKEAAATLVDQLAPGDQAALVTFNSQARLLQGLTGEAEDIDAALERIEVSQYTRIDLGIQRSTQELLSSRHKPDSRQVMVILTDGRANPVPGSEAVKRAAESKEVGIRILTIALGDEIDVDVLKSIASQQSDFYWPQPDAQRLAEIYRQIGFRLACPPRFWGGR